MLMAEAVSTLAAKTPGKEAIAMESFAKALRMLPIIIADNAGFDSAELIAQLRAAHSQGQKTFGLNMSEGSIADMASLGVTESFQVKRQVLLSASEAAEMILRVDDIIKAAPRYDRYRKIPVKALISLWLFFFFFCTIGCCEKVWFAKITDPQLAYFAESAPETITPADRIRLIQTIKEQEVFYVLSHLCPS
uniref:Chaperonin containing TCP1, subunit 2 (beta) n=1 Tax=Eptatretus burgeri TaxID=7764 RepID=A0A8C4Q0K3_EPTBU